MKLPFRPPKKKKLQATTTAARRPREADFTEEPNVKLSSAFVVVLVLHVVAVGGIYTFNALKAHQPPEYADTAPPPAAVQPSASTTDLNAAATAVPPAAPLVYRVKSDDSIAHIAAAYGVSAEALMNLNNLHGVGIHVGEELKLPPGAVDPNAQQASAKTAAKPATALRDSGTTYVVKSGDSPVSIARKLHVLYDDLIKLNNIEDPRKLKIGSKLKVPMKHATA